MKGLSFSEPMMLAWLDGRKTVTRRLINLQVDFDITGCQCINHDPPWFEFFNTKGKSRIIKPKYLPGETVYIKETWAHFLDHNPIGKVLYKATDPDFTDAERAMGWKWRSPRFMPEWASRSRARILFVKPERIQEINEIDAFLEGFRDEFRGNKFYPVGAQFKEIWENIHPGSWDRNDWVWRIELEKL